jgi:hypothetical protein
MSEVLAKFDAGDLLGLVAIVLTAVCGIVGILFAFYWQSQVTRRSEVTAALKQDMLNRGLSAEEIRAVLEAGPHEESSSGSRKLRA